MSSKESMIADCVISRQYTVWHVVEVSYRGEGDVAIATVCTETREEPKTRDNTRGFTVNFREQDYEEARRFARRVAAELGIKAGL